MDITWFDNDVYRLLMRLAINFVFITIIVRFFYYKITKRKEYLFTFYLMSFIIFFICYSLKKLDIDTGMGLGLFAIFSIIRYRTNQIAIKEMSYLFVVIGLSVVNALASDKISMTELGIINFFMLGMTYCIEFVWLLKNETTKTILFDNIDLVDVGNTNELRVALVNRTGLSINRVKVGKINYANNTAQLKIFYFDDDQTISNYISEEDSE